jgi:hypothetical protein
MNNFDSNHLAAINLDVVTGGVNWPGALNGALKGGTIGMISGTAIGAPAGPGGAAAGFAIGTLGGVAVGGYIGARSPKSANA